MSEMSKASAPSGGDPLEAMPDTGAKDDVLPGPPAGVDPTDDRSGGTSDDASETADPGTASGEPVIPPPSESRSIRRRAETRWTPRTPRVRVPRESVAASPAPTRCPTWPAPRTATQPSPSPNPPPPRSFERCVRSLRCTPVTSGVQREDPTQRPKLQGTEREGGGLVAALLQLDGDRGEGLALHVDAFGLQLGQRLLDVLVGLGRLRRLLGDDRRAGLVLGAEGDVNGLLPGGVLRSCRCRRSTARSAC